MGAVEEARYRDALRRISEMPVTSYASAAVRVASDALLGAAFVDGVCGCTEPGEGIHEERQTDCVDCGHPWSCHEGDGCLVPEPA